MVMYEDYGAGVVATFSRLTRRHDAIFQVILPGYHREHCLIGGVAIAAGLARAVRTSVPSLKEVAVGIGGAGRLHAVVALREPRPGEARKARLRSGRRSISSNKSSWSRTTSTHGTPSRSNGL